jgi:hypothetical protein
MFPKPTCDPSVVSTANFGYDGKKNAFTGMISDFGKEFSFGLGIVRLRSLRTGVVTTWQIAYTERDRENDIQYWRFEPDAVSILSNPGLINAKMFIFND